MKQRRWRWLVAGAVVAIPVTGPLLVRRPWVRPLSGVDLTPDVEVVRAEDVEPGSGTDRLRRALTSPLVGALRTPALLMLRSWSGDVRSYGWPPSEADETEAALALTAPLIEELREVLSDPETRYVAGADLHPEWRRASLGMRQVLSLIELRMHRHGAVGDWGAVADDLDLALGLIRVRGNGTGLDDTQSAAISRIELARNVRRMLGRHSVPEGEIRGWIERLISAEWDLQPTSRAVRIQSVDLEDRFKGHVMWVYERVEEEGFSSDGMAVLLYDFPSGFGTPERAIHPAAEIAFFIAFRVRAWLYRPSLRNAESAFQHAARAAESPDNAEAQASFEALLANPSRLDLLLSDDPIGSLLISGMVFRAMKLPEQSQRSRRELWAAAGGLALELHRREHGDLPADLADLTPAYLPAAWLDRILEFGFELERDADGAWAIGATLPLLSPPPSDEPRRYAPIPAEPRPPPTPDGTYRR